MIGVETIPPDLPWFSEYFFIFVFHRKVQATMVYQNSTHPTVCTWWTDGPGCHFIFYLLHIATKERDFLPKFPVKKRYTKKFHKIVILSS